jgi:hypothetical protein
MSEKPEIPIVYNNQIEFGREILLSALSEIDQTGKLTKTINIITVIDPSIFNDEEDE